MPSLVSSRALESLAAVGPLELDDLPDLREYLSWVPDPRGRRGRWHPIGFVLAVCAAAVMAGRSIPAEIAEWAADAPAEVLAALRVRPHPLRTRRAPSHGCLAAVLRRSDVEALDRAVAAWLGARRVLAENGTEPPAPAAIAVDGKTLRGTRTIEGRRVHLLSAVRHGSALTLAQREVSAKTNETGEFCNLLAWMDLEHTVVTFDSLHTVKAQVQWLTKAKGAHYITIVKRGQKHLYRQLNDLP